MSPHPGAYGALDVTSVPQEGETDSTPVPMNLDVLDEFAVNFGLTLAGMFAAEEAIIPLDMDQLGLVVYSGIAAVARQQPDYDPSTNVSLQVQLGVGSYTEGLYATVATNLKEDQPGETDVAAPGS